MNKRLLESASPENRIAAAVLGFMREPHSEHEDVYGQLVTLTSRLLLDYTASAVTLEDIFRAAWRKGYAISHENAVEILAQTAREGATESDGIDICVDEWWERNKHQPAHDWIGYFYVPGTSAPLFGSLGHAWDVARENGMDVTIIPVEDDEIPTLDEILDDASLVTLDAGNSPYFLATCAHCGWMGSSAELNGGNAMGDTGDLTDLVCPDCGQTDGIEDADRI